MKAEPISLVQLSGELDLARRDEFRAALREGNFKTPVLVDLSGVTYADSSALAELLRFQRDAAEIGTRVALVIASSQFKRIVEYAGLAEAFSIFDSREPAREFLESGSTR